MHQCFVCFLALRNECHLYITGCLILIIAVSCNSLGLKTNTLYVSLAYPMVPAGILHYATQDKIYQLY
jgi:hypothetical protein